MLRVLIQPPPKVIRITPNILHAGRATDIFVEGQYMGASQNDVGDIAFGPNGNEYHCTNVQWISSFTLSCTTPDNLPAASQFKLTVNVMGQISSPFSFVFVAPIPGTQLPAHTHIATVCPLVQPKPPDMRHLYPHVCFCLLPLLVGQLASPTR